MRDPLVTFVMYARNDGYTSDFVARMRLSIMVLQAQASHHRVTIEILIVEWNPPADRSSLKDALNLAPTDDFSVVRIVTVPPEEHARCKLASAKGMNPARALNVGYRRASGQFVTPKSSDSFLSDEVFAFLVDTPLDMSKVYRLNRYDIKPAALDVICAAAVNEGEAVLPDLAPYVIGCHTPQDSELAEPLGLLPLHTNAAGDFFLMARSKWHSMRGYREETDVLCLDADSIALHATVSHDLQEIRLPEDCKLYKPVHGNMGVERIKPDWTLYARAISGMARLVGRSAKSRAIIRGIFDVPRRKLNGIEGNHVSFERNFFLRVRGWPKRNRPVVLNGPNWGLADRQLSINLLDNKGIYND